MIVSTATNGSLPQDPRGAADYLDHGALPVPVKYMGKPPWDHASDRPREGWESLQPTPQMLGELFPEGKPSNVGLILGEPSRGLVDADLDCPQAVAAADVLLPKTGWVSGRAGSPRSHRFYRVVNPPSKAQDKYADLDGPCLLELRSTGGQTVVPHRSGRTRMTPTGPSPSSGTSSPTPRRSISWS
jgi:hypothetical protein